MIGGRVALLVWLALRDQVSVNGKPREAVAARSRRRKPTDKIAYNAQSREVAAAIRK